MDRLRKAMITGECLLQVVGFSFGDQHLNEILRQGLRTNTRLTINVFVFNEPNTELLELAKAHRNLSIYARTSACLQGNHGLWLQPSSKKPPGEQWPFWDEKKNEFLLGDFKSFAQFLDLIGGGTKAPPVGSTPSAPSGGATKQ